MTAAPLPIHTPDEPAVVFADAALGVAGHHVTDPVLRDILNRQARGEITPDQSREEGIARLQALRSKKQ